MSKLEDWGRLPLATTMWIRGRILGAELEVPVRKPHEASIKAECWEQAYKEAERWPSWERSGPRLKERYKELLRERGITDDGQ